MKKKFGLIVSFVFAMGLLAGCSGSASTDDAAASSAADEVVSSAPADDMASSEPASSEEESSEPTASDATAATPAAAGLEQAVMDYWANFPAEGNNQLPAEEIFKMIDNGDDIIILDIRSADDYAEGHLKGAVNIPYAQIGENLEAIPDDKPIWINCYTGQTSSQTTALLSFAGKDAHNIQSGWNRGITQTDGYEAYVETEENTLEAGNYPVDADIADAIKDYYAHSQDEPYPNYNFPVEDLQALVEQGSDEYTILSVRQAADYDEGHIAGAINIPFGQGMQESFSDIPTDKPVVVYCYTGQTASQVSASLRMLGYEAYNLNGGMGKEGAFGWLENNLPVVSTADEAGAAA